MSAARSSVVCLSRATSAASAFTRSELATTRRKALTGFISVRLSKFRGLCAAGAKGLRTRRRDRRAFRCRGPSSLDAARDGVHSAPHDEDCGPFDDKMDEDRHRQYEEQNQESDNQPLRVRTLETLGDPNDPHAVVADAGPHGQNRIEANVAYQVKRVSEIAKKIGDAVVLRGLKERRQTQCEEDNRKVHQRIVERVGLGQLE